MVLPAILAGAGIGLGIIGSAIAASGAGESDEQRRVRGMYRELALGKGPSYATQLIKAQGELASRRMVGAAMGANAANPNAAMRDASMQGADMQRDLIGQAAAIRAQEQLSAYQGWAQMANSAQALEQQQAAAWGAMFSGAGAGLTSMAGANPLAALGGGAGGPAAISAGPGGVGAAKAPLMSGGQNMPLGAAPTPMALQYQQGPVASPFQWGSLQGPAPQPAYSGNMVNGMRTSSGFPAGR